MEISTNLGRVSLVPRGRYDGAAVYNRLDMVEYEGSSYLVLADGVTGVTPPAGAVYMLAAEKGDRGETGAQGVQGETGNGIASIQRTAGSGAPGTRDTYTITYTDGSTYTFQVYNGADGTGAGDMRAETYDPTGKAQDVFAYADERAAAGRRGVNLLDNWYFPDPINQRGQTEYTRAGYTIDRWYAEADRTIKLVNDGIVFSPDSSKWNVFAQYIEHYKALIGKTCTLSVLIAENTCSNAVLWFYGGISDNFASVKLGADKLYSVTMTPKSNITSMRCGIQGRNSSGSVKILAFKLELGDHQTLAHQDASGSWVLNDPPPDRTLELLKCRRYQQVFDWGKENFVIGYGYTTSTTTANAFLPTMPKMRVPPAISNTDGRNWSCTTNGARVEITSISIWFSTNYGIGIRVTGDFPSGAGHPLIINSNSANKVIFDANL